MNKRKINKIREAWQLLRSVRNNAEDGFSECMAIRWVCRYHCLVEARGWDIRWRFQKPKSRMDFIDMCDRCLEEIDWVWKMDYFDKKSHHQLCRSTLLRLRAIARCMPLLWFAVFRLHF